LTHWLSLSWRNAFSSPGFCRALSQAERTFSSVIVAPSEGLAFSQVAGSVQSSFSSAP